MPPRFGLAAAALALSLFGCPDKPPAAVDASQASLDPGALDASALDASALDASAVDASAVDVSAVDASAVDASALDAGADAGQESRRRRVIYQLVMRTFGNVNPTRATDGTLEQNGVGMFEDVNAAALASLRDLGVTDIWLTGVLRQATLADHSDVGLAPDDPDVVKGRAGSFYAVRDYFDVCPDYAVDKSRRLDELAALIDG